jgi:crossover junction endodeoxyribonuclease RusA
MGPSIHLPFPPSANRLFANKVRGGRMRSREYKSWIETAGLELMRQRPKKFEGPVTISIVASPPHTRRRDLDNLLKAALDLLVAHAIIVDDSTDYLKALSISLGNADPGLDITVTAACANVCFRG